MQILDSLPAAVKPAAGLSAYLEVLATGVQIYTCAKNDSGAWTWVHKGPEAQLFDTEKKLLGKHYGGPSWEGLDGGKVVGALNGSVPAPVASAIPWLLLDIRSREGNGIFTQAKAILRIETEGGLAPSMACSEKETGKIVRVPYKANYLFLK